MVHHSRQGGVNPNLRAAILQSVEVLLANASRRILTDIYNLSDQTSSTEMSSTVIMTLYHALTQHTTTSMPA